VVVIGDKIRPLYTTKNVKQQDIIISPSSTFCVTTLPRFWTIV